MKAQLQENKARNNNLNLTRTILHIYYIAQQLINNYSDIQSFRNMYDAKWRYLSFARGFFSPSLFPLLFRMTSLGIFNMTVWSADFPPINLNYRRGYLTYFDCGVRWILINSPLGYPWRSLLKMNNNKSFIFKDRRKYEMYT